MKRVAASIPSARVVRVLEQLVEIYGCPKTVRCDNRPEFIAQAFIDWAKHRPVEVIFIQHGKSDHNAFVERFNRTYRQEVLN